PRNFQGLRPPYYTFGTRQTLFGAYVQDDVKLLPNFTINAGLRYEMATVPTDVHNRVSNLQHLTDAQPQIGGAYFLNPTLRNFEPRLGFAWSPFRNGKTILRGGFGIFDVLPLPYTFELITPYATPFSVQVFADGVPPGSFPSGAFQEFSNLPGVARGSYVEHQPKRSYVMQWNLGVAREISSTLIATVAYVGSRGVHQPYKGDNFDTVFPTLTPAGYVYPVPGTAQRLNPNFGRIAGMMWQANSFYDALQVDLTKKVSHGVEIHGAYTWGKSIDTLSATMADDAYPNGILNPPFFDQRTTRGLSDFNIGQELVVNFTWEVPTPRFHSELVKRALGGWQFGGIYKASSGQPFTPFIGGDPLGTKLDQVSNPPNRVVGPGCANLTNIGNPNHYIKTQCLAFLTPGLRGNLGRNTLIGPGISKFDFSVFKNNHVQRISETFNAQFRAEFFNVFNRANFASPTDNLFVFDQQGNPVPSAGLITSTQTTSRQIQFALKLIW
ncbi:MAG: TonB-dependent receptor, partial [Acidobacteriota bacterium]|nr:TonB-dependent receptor [Acidobacteriota bacterium]